VQACAGLRAAHNASICHRDIKPGNLFVRSDGLLKILDFGVARVATSSMTAAGFVIGTPDYMSPEQARGDDIDDRSDIFSLGGVFYFMLTGRKPFPATQLPPLFRQIQSVDPVPITPEEAPEGLAAIIMRAMAKNPEARYQNCHELMADLNTLRLALPFDEPTATDDASADDPHGAEDKSALLDVATAPREMSTADTVDMPAPGAKTDETVTLRPPTWIGRTRTLVDTAISRTLAHLWWPATPPARPRQTGIRKR
jgi:serine/threonine protein kinase